MTDKTKFIEPGPALSLADINSFEQEIDGRLPDDYKRFLMKCNGGMADPPLGLPWNGRIHLVPDFRTLLPTHEFGLRRALANLRELNVDGFLPITSTQNQDDICLDFRDNIGTVWLAVYAYQNDVPVDVNLRPLAPSFTELWEILVPVPEPYCRIEELGKHGTESDLQQYLAEGHSIDAISKNNLSLVCEAIKFENLDMIEACIARGANLSKTIHQAVTNDRPELVCRFVEAGVDVNEQDESGARPTKYVAGTALPGDEGARNRAMRDLLLSMGAIPEKNANFE